MSTIHLISHTHWDREWYLTFQQFRLKLVHLIDRVLEILQDDQDFKYFLLDGQTILLDDYLQIRPEKETELRKLISVFIFFYSFLLIFSPVFFIKFSNFTIPISPLPLSLILTEFDCFSLSPTTSK